MDWQFVVASEDDGRLVYDGEILANDRIVVHMAVELRLRIGLRICCEDSTGFIFCKKQRIRAGFYCSLGGGVVGRYVGDPGTSSEYDNVTFFQMVDGAQSDEGFRDSIHRYSAHYPYFDFSL